MVKQEVKKRAINRLNSMYALRAQVDKFYTDSQEAEKAGMPTAWCMLDGGYGGPFLSAMNIKSVFPENFGTVCAASGAAAPFLERSAAEGFPDHLCGYARNCLGYTARMVELGDIPPEAPQGGMPKPILLLSSGMLCDARYKWFQALGRYLDAPVWTLEFPIPGARESLVEGAHDRNVSFVVKELKEFAAFLERLLGKKMDWDRFEKELDDTIKMDAVWWEVNELRKAIPGPMHSRDFWSSMAASVLSTTDPQGVTDLYRKMYDEVKYRVDNKISAINYEEKYRMVFLGLPPWHALGFFDQLAERGWNFVIEGTYHPPRPIDLSKVKDPVERMVRYRNQGLARQIGTEFEPEEAAEIKEEIKKKGFSNKLSGILVRNYKCDGAFLHTLLTCRGTSAPLLNLRNQMMEVWKVPSLAIEGDIVDTRLFDPVDAMRKAEAFEETMNHYKKIRQEQGLGW